MQNIANASRPGSEGDRTLAFGNRQMQPDEHSNARRQDDKARPRLYVSS